MWSLPQHTTTPNTRCGRVYCRTSPHTTQLSLPTHARDTPMVLVSTRKHTHTKWSSHQLTWQQGGALKLPHSTALPSTGQDRTGGGWRERCTHTHTAHLGLTDERALLVVETAHLLVSPQLQQVERGTFVDYCDLPYGMGLTAGHSDKGTELGCWCTQSTS